MSDKKERLCDNGWRNFLDKKAVQQALSKEERAIREMITHIAELKEENEQLKNQNALLDANPEYIEFLEKERDALRKALGTIMSYTKFGTGSVQKIRRVAGNALAASTKRKENE